MPMNFAAWNNYKNSDSLLFFGFLVRTNSRLTDNVRCKIRKDMYNNTQKRSEAGCGLLRIESSKTMASSEAPYQA